MKILLVDDEASLCEALGMILRRAGYEFVCAQDGRTGLAYFERETPDLVILDVMLPGLNGFDLCEELRARSSEVPILMLSAKSDIVDKRVGFKSGADDYLAKPFDEEELLLRIEVLLRRSSLTRDRQDLRPASRGASELVIDPERFEVIVRGKPVAMTPKEYQILELLASRPGNVFTRDEIIRTVWGESYRDTSISIPSYVRRIREKIEKNPSDPVLLQTVFGFGYRLGE